MDKLELIVSKIEDLKNDSDKRHDQMQEDISDIKDSMIEMTFDVRRNADDLELHMKRTELNEKRIANIEDKLTVEHLLKLIMTVIGGVSLIAGTVAAIIKLYNLL
jgi:hypothetical protein